MPQGLACLRAGVLAVLNHLDSVHEHVGDASGIMVGVLVGGGVLDLVGVEHYDVRPVAFAQFAAAFEVEGVRRPGSNLSLAPHILPCCVRSHPGMQLCVHGVRRAHLQRLLIIHAVDVFVKHVMLGR